MALLLKIYIGILVLFCIGIGACALRNGGVVNFVHWVQSAGIIGMIIYGLLQTVATIAVMPGLALALGAGYLYGPFWGMVVIVPASVIGSMCSFFIGRYLTHDLAKRYAGKIRRFKSIQTLMDKKGEWLIFLLYAHPFTPFRILSYALSLTNITAKRFMVPVCMAMVFHMIPYIYMGSLAADFADLFSGSFFAKMTESGMSFFILIATIVLACGLFAFILQLAINRMMEKTKV